MKILHVIHSLDPRSGGPSHALRGLVREQVRARHDVSVLATTVQSAEPWEPREEYVRRVQEDGDLAGAETVLGTAYGRRRPWSRFAYSPECRRWLKQKLSERERVPDFMHIHGTFSHLTANSASLARRHGIPYAIRPAGSLNKACFQQGRRWLKEVSLKMFLQQDLREASFVHAMSDSEALELASFVPENMIRVVPHGVQAPSRKLHSARAALLEQYPQLRDKRIVLFLGRLHCKKRPELLVDAVSRIRSEFPDLMILFAGSDAGQLELLKKGVAAQGLEGRVVFSGFLQGAMKDAAFETASVFALPSVDENFGVSVVEAMAQGTPVLVTPGVAAHVYVDESGGGLTVEDDAESIAAGIRRLLSADRRELGERGREYVRRHLSWGAVVRQLDDLYREAIEQSQHVHSG